MTRPNYWEYLKIDELLNLQTGIEDSESRVTNDELLFITAHQVEELWFKVLLREVTTVRDILAKPFVSEETIEVAVRHLNRATHILSDATSPLRILETMATIDYLAFRTKLYPASGFQSAQIRELEILLGLTEQMRIPLGKTNYLDALRDHEGKETSAYRKVKKRMEDGPTLLSAVEEWIYRTPIDGSRPSDPNDESTISEYVSLFLRAHSNENQKSSNHAKTKVQSTGEQQRIVERYERESSEAKAHLCADDVAPENRARKRRIRAALFFIESYRHLPLLAWPRTLIESILAFEQSFIIFRQRHARMVERIIGTRTGSGGSIGIAYLDRTALEYRIFKDLWATRTLLVQTNALPDIRMTENYEFQAQRR